tara:strand:- start:455 stop:1510 length:1056 start_codon:yes stop_codon:yes gene_type:complete
VISNTVILEISIKRLIYNYKFFQKLNKKNITAATIKANAYGLGSMMIYKILYKSGCRNFFVATVNEGIELRHKYKKGNIYILNGTENNKINIFKKFSLIPIINDFNEAKLISNKKIKYGLHIDTGINRLGCSFNEINNELINNKKLKLVISHLASADEYNNNYNVLQKEKFKKLIEKFNNNQIIYSLSNSHGALISKDFLFNMIRPGISIYGGHNNSKVKKYIKPVIKLKAKILQIKKIFKNEYIGYNQTYKTKNNIYVAIIGIGYADGIKRFLSNNGTVYFKKKKFKIIGRVSMDSITIDITKHNKIFKIGKYIEIINYDHGIDELADKCETISNEIITSISKRVKRLYV